MTTRIYTAIILVTLSYLPFLPFSPFSFHAVNLIQWKDGQPMALSFPSPEEAEAYLHRFEVKADGENEGYQHSESPIDSTFFSDGALYWGQGTTEIRERVEQLRQESTIFNRVLDMVSGAEYPYYIVSEKLNQAIGEFSSLNGELRFSVDKMNGFFFDATIIEEFVHAYQATFYNYAHGNCRKIDYRFAQQFGDVGYKKRLENGLRSWEKFGSKQAYIESEAKIITYLIQNQSPSISLQDIVDTDDYNSGGKARALLLPYFNRRNCTTYKRTDKLLVLDDIYVEMELFMRYQNSFIRHWKHYAPHSQYTKGRFKHRPSALQALQQK